MIIQAGMNYIDICSTLHKTKTHKTTNYSESIRKGWEILCIISVTFPPSKNLEAYLTDFVKQSHHILENDVGIMSQHVSTKLKRVCTRGAKGKVLTSAEIMRAKVSRACYYPLIYIVTMLILLGSAL
jgi:hypothetical protein